MNRVRVCPNCGGHDIVSNRSNVIALMGLQSDYRCQDCDYDGIFPEVAPEELEEYKADAVERGPMNEPEPVSDFNRGRLVLGIVMFIAGLGAVQVAGLEAFITGALSTLIGAAVVFEQLRDRYRKQ